MSEIAQAIADRQSEIDRLKAEIKALTDVEQILGASAPAARSTSRRSSSPPKAAAAADKSEAKPARKRREMSAGGEEGGIGAHDRLLGRTEEEGRQEVGAPPILKPPTAAHDAALDDQAPSSDRRRDSEPRGRGGALMPYGTERGMAVWSRPKLPDRSVRPGQRTAASPSRPRSTGGLCTAPPGRRRRFEAAREEFRFAWRRASALPARFAGAPPGTRPTTRRNARPPPEEESIARRPSDQQHTLTAHGLADSATDRPRQWPRPAVDQ